MGEKQLRLFLVLSSCLYDDAMGPEAFLIREAGEDGKGCPINYQFVI